MRIYLVMTFITSVVLDQQEEEISYEVHHYTQDHEDYDDYDDIEIDLHSNVVEPVEFLIYQTMEEKRYVKDLLFNLWLGVLEAKKRLLFSIWKKKFGIKEEPEERHHQYYIPYYSTTTSQDCREENNEIYSSTTETSYHRPHSENDQYIKSTTTQIPNYE